MSIAAHASTPNTARSEITTVKPGKPVAGAKPAVSTATELKAQLAGAKRALSDANAVLKSASKAVADQERSYAGILKQVKKEHGEAIKALAPAVKSSQKAVDVAQKVFDSLAT